MHHSYGRLAELELRNLQLRALAIDDSPVLAPVELERFAGRKPERNKRPAPGRLCLLVLFLSPASGKRRHTVIETGEAQRAEVRVNLLEGSALLAGPVCLGLEPACELRSKPVELAGAVALGIGRQHSVGPYVTPDGVSGHAQSFGFEFRCDDGTPLRVTFALDCCDREAISWAATTGGHSGDVVRDVMLAAVEQRFGATQVAQPIEWLTDNGSAYIDHRTRSFARELGLQPLTTPVRSPQSNGMAESFVKTMKHNYVAYLRQDRRCRSRASHPARGVQTLSRDCRAA